MKKSGFTLAEVLITLGVIGVVAALTIPILLNKTENDVKVTKLKKTYSVLTSAFKQLATDQGCPGSLQCTNIFEGTDRTTLTRVGNAITPYLKLNKDCGEDADSECFPDSIKIPKLPQYVTELYKIKKDGYNILTIDGVGVSILLEGDNCNVRLGSGSLSKVCGYVFVDLDGPKGENMFSKDNFEYILTNTGDLYPEGGKAIDDTNQHWDTDPDGYYSCVYATRGCGRGCAARIMERGWKIDY